MLNDYLTQTLVFLVGAELIRINSYLRRLNKIIYFKRVCVYTCKTIATTHTITFINRKISSYTYIPYISELGIN